MPIVVGVDPGLTGAIALVGGERGERLVEVMDMPVKRVGKAKREELDVEALRYMLALARRRADVLVMERQGAAPGQGVSSTFKLGAQYGMLHGMAIVMGFRVERVSPAEWKAALRLGADKERSREAAMKAWPADQVFFARVKDHGRAEAALIALWAHRAHVLAVAKHEVA
jgi:crossover junction endodeoxyribonuclease RuvC